MIPDLKDLCPDRHGRILFRLGKGILVAAGLVPPAPGDVIGSQDAVQFVVIDREFIIPSLDAAGFSAIPVWNAEPPAFVIHEAVKAYEPERAKVKGQFPCYFQNTGAFPTAGKVFFFRHAVDCPVIPCVLPAAPPYCFDVKVGHMAEDSPCQEVILYETDKAFNFSFGKRMARPAKFRLETDQLHKGFIVMLPDWMPVRIPADYNALHV